MIVTFPAVALVVCNLELKLHILLIKLILVVVALETRIIDRLRNLNLGVSRL